MYINEHIGHKGDGEYGTMYFNETLLDWSKFDINRRTKHDASISSGLAIMACNKNKYVPIFKLKKEVFPLGFKKYNNQGNMSQIIK